MSDSIETSPVTFESLSLDEAIQRALVDAGYTSPTPVQNAAIPALLEGKDVLASAQTGTGKTAAFMLPAIQRLVTRSENRSRGPRVLVLTPTRELAQQVTDAAQRYGKNLRFARVVSIVGGASYTVQNRLLANPVDILVATPGRLMDHMQRGRIDFSRLELLVLDEADRMLDMGFSEAVEAIAAELPQERQTALFSATLEGVVGRLADKLLKDPVRIQISTAKDKHEQIEQRLHYVDDQDHKKRLLRHLLTDVELKQAIVFTATKRDADQIADELAEEGHPVGALHGDMSQRDRTRTLTQMRRGQIRVLIATDVAARGLDVSGITHVINYDLPKFAEDYVHRIGRTGRAGANGIAISFAAGRDRVLLQRIEQFTGQRILSHVIAGLEPKVKPGFGGKRNGAGHGGAGRGRRDGGDARRESFGGRKGDFQSRGGNGGGQEGFQSSYGQRGNGGFASRGQGAGHGNGFGGERARGQQQQGQRRDPAPGNMRQQGNSGHYGEYSGATLTMHEPRVLRHVEATERPRGGYEQRGFEQRGYEQQRGYGGEQRRRNPGQGERSGERQERGNSTFPSRAWLED